MSMCLGSCAILSKNQNYTSINLEYDQSQNINYAGVIPIKIKMSNEEGKQKDITDKRDLQIVLTGGTFLDGNIYIDSFPKSFDETQIKITASYIHNENSLTNTALIDYNFKGTLTINFQGVDGIEGDKANRKLKPVLLSDGKDGRDGEDGLNGSHGREISVKVWKHTSDEFYVFKVEDLITNQIFYYKYYDNGFGVKIDASGGQGGKGGNGSKGTDGRKGRIKDDSNINPGDGGNGGNGGNGGTGGNGGKVYLYLHPTAENLKQKILVYNLGGKAGEAGAAGEAGDPGKALDGQEEGKQGIDGQVGKIGKSGESGPLPQIMIENFNRSTEE